MRQSQLEQEQQWHLHESANLRAAVILERERKRMEKEKAKELFLENKHLAESTKQKKLEKVKHQQELGVTDDFFKQFNTSSR